MKEIVLGIWLGVLGIWDFKYKEIPLWFSVCGGGIGVLYVVLERKSIEEVLIACLPGLGALLFSWVSRERMGYGDGVVLLAMGFYLSIHQVMLMGMLAFFLAAVVALLLIIIGKKKRNYRMPFVPILWVAYVFSIGIGG